MRWLLLTLAVGLVVGSSGPVLAARPEQTLEVQDLRVTFLEGSRVRVTGKLRCKGIDQGFDDSPEIAGSVDVAVEYPGPDGTFALLPEYFAGRSVDAPVEEWLDAVGAYFHQGKWYHVDKPGPRFYSSTALPYPAVLDRPLDQEKDEGQWIPFDETQPFAGRAGEGARYRVVISWRYEYLNDRTIHCYFWVVYGPFSWGEGPLCVKPLVAHALRPVTFDGAKVQVGKPAGDPPAEVQVPDAGGEDAEEPPVPKRSGNRPNQGAAADACNALAEKLGRWPTIQRAGATANPRAAVVNVDVAPEVPAEELAGLVARVAAEAAAALEWVQTVELTIRGTHGTTQVGCARDAIVAFATKETTLREFHATWSLQGDALPAPP